MCVRNSLFYAATVRDLPSLANEAVDSAIERLAGALDATIQEARRRRAMNHTRTYSTLLNDAEWAMPTLRKLCAERDRRRTRKMIRSAKESGLLDFAG